VLHDTRQAWPGDLATTCEHESWLVDLRAGEQAVWDGLDRNIRRQVRMAQRNGLVAEVDRTGARLGDFYDVLSRFTHQAGTPLYGRNFLENIVAAFPDGFNIVMVYQAGRPLGGYFQLELGKTSFGAWGATLHEYLELRPVYLAYWEILADSARRGLEWLDMGRSPAGSSASHYKRQWATTSVPVYQQTVPVGEACTAASVAGQARHDARFRSVRRLWPRLPLPVAQFLGPHLRRHVPFA
jgi:CelD/BcsL family acetyltransferase involved in cellulose biosynthesis